jgi:hypothetical protein
MWPFVTLVSAIASSGATYLWVDATRSTAPVVVDAVMGGNGERCPEGYRLIGWQASASRTGAVLTPDIARPIKYKTFYDNSTGLMSSALSMTAADFGTSESELKRIAQAQGVDLDAIYNARIKGRTFDEIAKAGKDRGVIGFMTPEERENAVRSAALCEPK